MLSPGAYRFTVPEEASGQRIDQFLGNCGEGFSRTLARRLIEVGGVHLAGRRLRRCSHPVTAGQRLEVFVDGLPLEGFDLTGEHVIYRDDTIIVLNKPPGIATQPTPARFRGTLYDALLRYLQQGDGRRGKPSLGMVQRLDRDTSGLLVFSIHPRAHKGLTASFGSHAVRKIYRALVAGGPGDDAGTIRSNLARRRSNNRTVSVKKGGKPAETRYRLLERFAGAALLEVELLTGRTHQIRAHFSEAGFPLLGDTDYNGPAEIAGIVPARQMLHAHELAFAHPVTGEALRFLAPQPEDFTTVLEALTDRQGR